KCHFRTEDNQCGIFTPPRTIYRVDADCAWGMFEETWQRKQDARLLSMKSHPEDFAICEGCKRMDKKGQCEFARVLMGPNASCEKKEPANGKR
ncbi:MAG: hypothetical protein RSC00_04370, partial [Ruthenibacterium sp.]